MWLLFGLSRQIGITLSIRKRRRQNIRGRLRARWLVRESTRLESQIVIYASDRVFGIKTMQISLIFIIWTYLLHGSSSIRNFETRNFEESEIKNVWWIKIVIILVSLSLSLSLFGAYKGKILSYISYISAVKITWNVSIWEISGLHYHTYFITCSSPMMNMIANRYKIRIAHSNSLITHPVTVYAVVSGNHSRRSNAVESGAEINVRWRNEGEIANN